MPAICADLSLHLEPCSSISRLQLIKPTEIRANTTSSHAMTVGAMNAALPPSLMTYDPCEEIGDHDPPVCQIDDMENDVEVRMRAQCVCSRNSSKAGNVRCIFAAIK